MSGAALDSLANWFWVIIFITAIVYLQTLLSDMRSQTDQLSDERKQFQGQIEDLREGNRKLSEELISSAQRAIDRLQEAQLEYRYESFFAPRSDAVRE